MRLPRRATPPMPTMLHISSPHPKVHTMRCFNMCQRQLMLDLPFVCRVIREVFIYLYIFMFVHVWLYLRCFSLKRAVNS
jgi:hypothetical protein